MPASVSGADAFTSTGTQSSTSVPLPSHGTGDIVFVSLCMNQAGGSFTTPTDWNVVGAGTLSASNLTSVAYWRRAASTNQFGSSLSVTHSTFRRTSAASHIVTGGSASVDPYGSGAAGTQNGNWPNVTVTGNDTLLLGHANYRNESASGFTYDSDWFEDDFADGAAVSGASDTGIRCAHRTSLVASGAYTGESVNGPVSNNIHRWILAVESAAGGSTVNGTADATLTFTGPAAGTPTVLGAAATTLTFTAPAVGLVERLGVAATALTFTAPAQGTVTAEEVTGVAATALTFTAEAAGSLTGTAATDLTFAAPAQGMGSDPNAGGIASSEFVFAAPATGTSTPPAGTATADLLFVSTVTGTVTRSGAASTVLVFAAPAGAPAPVITAVYARVTTRRRPDHTTSSRRKSSF